MGKAGIYFILTVAGFGVYINTLYHPFIWDDFLYIVHNPRLEDPRFISSYFTSSFCEGAAKGCDFFRPFVSLSYLMDFRIWGKNPFGFHLTGVLIHVGVVLLFYGVASRLFYSHRGAFFSALLFAVHPIHTESITFVAARTDPPAAFFYLLALYFFDRHLRSVRESPERKSFVWNVRGKTFWFLFLSLTAYGFGLLTKEIAVTLPLMVLVYDLVCLRPWRGISDLARRWKSYIGFGLVLWVYFYMRNEALGFGVTQDLKWDALGERLWLVPGLFWDYFRINLFPYPLILLHEPPRLFGSSTWAALWGVLFLVLYLFAIFRFRGESKAIPFGGLWFLIGFLPVLNIIPIPWPAVVERFSYVPSLGFCLAAGFWTDAGLKKLGTVERPWLRRLSVGGIACILLVLSIMTVARNQTWGNELALWQDTVRKVPQSAYAHRNLGRVYHSRGELKRAIDAYEESLKVDPSMSVTHHILGVLYQSVGSNDRALGHYQTLIRTNRAFPSTYFNMGVLFEGRGEYSRAVAFYEKVLRLDPDHQNARARLKSLLTLLDRGPAHGQDSR